MEVGVLQAGDPATVANLTNAVGQGRLRQRTTPSGKSSAAQSSAARGGGSRGSWTGLLSAPHPLRLPPQESGPSMLQYLLVVGYPAGV